GVIAHLRDRAADLHAMLLGTRIRLGPHVIARDVESLRRHVPRHLQPHGAEPDHAGACHPVCFTHFGCPALHSCAFGAPPLPPGRLPERRPPPGPPPRIAPPPPRPTRRPRARRRAPAPDRVRAGRRSRRRRACRGETRRPPPADSPRSASAGASPCRCRG